MNDGKKQFERLRNRLVTAYPMLTDGQQQYAVNKLANYIRKFRDDIYDVAVGDVPEHWQYYVSSQITLRNFRIYFHILID